MWALVIVCAALATLAGGTIKWSIRHLEAKEQECKDERKEDQSEFLKALAQRDTHMSALTATVQEMNVILVKHDEKMDVKHSIEVSTIARMAGEAAVEKYILENPKRG